MSKILILGAGASYDHGITSVDRPPLTKDFFSDSLKKKFGSKYNPLWDYIEKLELSEDLEEIFGSIESYSILTADRYRESNIERFGKEFEYCIPVDFLRSYVIDVIISTTSWLKKGKSCPFHNYLAKDWLRDGDLAISFNYDLIFDMALKRTGKWHESSGYGAVISLLDSLDYNDYQKSSILLLKPHGSLNFVRNKQTTTGETEYKIGIYSLEKTLKRFGKPPHIVPNWIDTISQSKLPNNSFQRYIFCLRKDTMGQDPFLIIPTPTKPLEDMTTGIMQIGWKRIEKALITATDLLSIGFSWRDSYFASFVRSTIYKRKHPLNLHIVSGNNTVKNVENIFSSLIPSKIQIKHAGNTFEEFIHRI
ncbi:hypothetical protein ACFLY8_02210 [Halobacteriota archaeon]